MISGMGKEEYNISSVANKRKEWIILSLPLMIITTHYAGNVIIDAYMSKRSIELNQVALAFFLV